MDRELAELSETVEATLRRANVLVAESAALVERSRALRQRLEHVRAARRDLISPNRPLDDAPDA